MFGAGIVRAIARTLVGLTLATALAAGTTGQANASMSNAYMACGEGTETVYFGLPLSGAARMSIFAFSVDGGAWQFTHWYYTDNGSYWHFDPAQARWVGMPPEGSQSTWIVGNRHNVVGFEYRYIPSTQTGSWISLGSCRTTSFFDGGIVYN
jgi:hypothetical protein